MPINCPKCNRGNGENRLKCIYCGNPLPQAEVLVDASQAAPKLVKRAGSSHYLMLLLPKEDGTDYPPSLLTPSHVALLAKRLKTDRYHLNQWTKIRAPKILKIFPKKEEAEFLTAQINKMGFRVYLIANEKLNGFGYSFRAYGAQLNSGFHFIGKDNDRLVLDPQKVFFMSKGRVKVQKEPELKKKKSKDRMDGLIAGSGVSATSALRKKASQSVSAAIALAKHEGERVLSEGSESQFVDTTDYLIFDLFCNDGQTPPLRVKSSEFDFTCMGKNTSPSSLINFVNLIEIFQKQCPNLVVDESFNKVPPIFTDEQSASLFDPTLEYFSKPKSVGSYHNNERQFDQYSRIVCYLFQHGVKNFA